LFINASVRAIVQVRRRDTEWVPYILVRLAHYLWYESQITLPFIVCLWLFMDFYWFVLAFILENYFDVDECIMALKMSAFWIGIINASSSMINFVGKT
jgi:hypothetical protein